MSLKERAAKLLVAGWAGAAGARAWFVRLYARPSSRRAVLGLIALVAAIGLVSKSVSRIREGEVGVFVNNVTGSMQVEQRAGYHLFIPWVHSMHRLDRRIQSLAMSEAGGSGFRGGDAVKIKTSDGSNVSLDILVTYRLLADRAAQVLKDSGVGMAFGDLWIRSAVRAMAAREFGKLTTEQVYDAAARNERAQAVVEGLNKELLDRGVEVVAAVPQEFRFYKEYEEVIKNKKLADQEVEEQMAKARLAMEEQKKKVAEAEYTAAAKVATAKGDAERTKAEAEGYTSRVRIEGESTLATMEKQAEGRLAIGLADAEGQRQSALALAGGGGVNLVALEYAKQLGKISFTGVPVVQDGRMGQHRIQQVAPLVGALPAPAAASSPATAALGGAAR